MTCAAACRGRVLEIGFGSGLNVAAYPAAGHLAWTPSSRPTSAGSCPPSAAPGAAVPVERVGLDGQRLAAADATYDAVLSTFTLCTIPDVADGAGGGTPGAAPRRRTARPRARPRAGPEGGRVAAPAERAPGTGRRRLPPEPGRPRARRGGRVHRRAARPGLPARARRREAVDLRVPGDRGAPDTRQRVRRPSRGGPAPARTSDRRAAAARGCRRTSSTRGLADERETARRHRRRAGTASPAAVEWPPGSTPVGRRCGVARILPRSPTLRRR